MELGGGYASAGFSLRAYDHHTKYIGYELVKSRLENKARAGKKFKIVMLFLDLFAENVPDFLKDCRADMPMKPDWLERVPLTEALLNGKYPSYVYTTRGQEDNR